MKQNLKATEHKKQCETNRYTAHKNLFAKASNSSN